jgi:lysophospholipase L1-like esterase
MATASTHPALPPDVLNPRDIGHGEADLQPDDPNYDWHFLAEGDSWFTIAAIPSSNLLFELRLGRWTQILNLAYPGDTLRHIGSLADNDDLQKFIAKRNFNYHWDAMLFSAGGNDLIDAAPRLIRTQPAAGRDPQLPQSYVDEQGLAQLLSDIQNALIRMAALRDAPDSKSRDCPIFIHTYDYPTPHNAPARFIGIAPIKGPWLQPVFADGRIALPMQQRIVNHLIDGLADALLALDAANTSSASAIRDFHVIDTRNTLVMANPVDVGVSNDWLNEIHPNHEGYRKIANRISAAVNDAMLR